MIDLNFNTSTLAQLEIELKEFSEYGTQTKVERCKPRKDISVPVYINEYWTAKQRAACNLHEVSYRACFKPQLPRFFIERLTRPGDVVYDPFMGRGTTLLESALLGRRAWGCDISPLSEILISPRLSPPSLEEVKLRLSEIPWNSFQLISTDLLVFYHRETLEEISALRNYLALRKEQGNYDRVDAWIQMVATNRLTGHSPGFFSVYTLPPNQATSIERQIKINAKRKQVPTRRNVPELILRKSKSLLKDLTEQEITNLTQLSSQHKLLIASSDETSELPANSVHLVVTSPPFLNVVQYNKDNWLRCWFNSINGEKVKLWQHRDLDKWQAAMKGVFIELKRILIPGGIIAFEVGEVENGSIQLEETTLEAAKDAGLIVDFVMINSQNFTKTSHCWGIVNQDYGTNTNRVVICHKD